MSIAIDDATIERFEGGVFVVSTVTHGMLLVPQEVIDDESEVWQVGDAGTLLVLNWWARQRGIRGKRRPRTVESPPVPIELTRKAAVHAEVVAPASPEKKKRKAVKKKGKAKRGVAVPKKKATSNKPKRGRAEEKQAAAFQRAVRLIAQGIRRQNMVRDDGAGE